MALRDLTLPARRFQIDAADISTRLLASARRGIYSSNAFRSSDLSFRARYFHELSHGYELDSSIRSTVRFFQASVLDSHLLTASAPYDVVFCRNLLIYLDTSTRIALLATFQRLLVDDGLLFVGHADRLDVTGLESKFTVVADPACFVYRLRAQGDAIRSVPVLQLNPPQTIPAQLAPGMRASGILPVVSPGARASYTQADRTAGVSVPASTVNEASLLAEASELANKGRFDDAITACEQHVRLKGYSPLAYYLMGMICQAAGNRTQAEDCFHKTVYLDPMHDEALLALALFAERRGDDNAANSFRRRARALRPW